MPARLTMFVLLHALVVPLEGTRVAESSELSRWPGTLAVPGEWADLPPATPEEGDVVWLRSKLNVPNGWKGKRVELRIERLRGAHEAYVNGHRVGAAGTFAPKFATGHDTPKRYVVDPAHLAFGGPNVVVLRVRPDGAGGFAGPAPALVGETHGIWLSGTWEYRRGDDPTWAKPTADEIGNVALRTVQLPAFKFRELASTGDDVLAPNASLARMSTPDDLEAEIVLAEPIVRQPVSMHFDTRGRLWVVNYEQYPNPAGLRMLSRDKHWRAVYDKVPEPPPHGVKGRDRITIHEDTNGDGAFDRHRVFVDDLNIATACAVGRGGVWVMNPPYLLFYPDADGDDVPDGDPEVHLEGFGLEDTHSCANSLTWGPDGWLYGAQGSTVSGNIRRPGEKKGVFSMGQNVWRYDPRTKRYEIFAEGGGNAFGIEFDDEGRVFSGHNGGNTRGFHYVQGGYFRKGFGKHGPLSNPHAFGYFPHMKHHDVPRFTHDFVLYDDTALPERFRGQLFGVEPLQGQVVRAEFTDDGSTFRTRDLDRVLSTDEKRFRPVAIEIGPDGNLYVADFHEPQISHREHFAGIVERETGRVVRLRSPGAKPRDVPNIAEASPDELIGLLRSPERWRWRAALRAIADRGDVSMAAALRKHVSEGEGPFALRCLWAVAQLTGVPEYHVRDWTKHAHAPVREWTVRLACDDGEVSSPVARRLAEMAADEPDVRVRSQLACSARRLPVEQCMPIVAGLLRRNEDAADPHLPLLLWWAIESKCEEDGSAVIAGLADETLWERPLLRDHVLERLMRRFASTGRRRDLLLCAHLLDAAPNDDARKRLMAGFEQAFRGRALGGLPDELVAALAGAGGGSLSLRLRQGERVAIEEALARIVDAKADDRLELISTFGEIREKRAVEPLLAVLANAKDASTRRAVLGALGAFDDERIGLVIVARVPKAAAEETDDASGANDERNLALGLLAGRAAWSAALLDAIDAGRIDADSIPASVVRKIALHRDEEVVARAAKRWTSAAATSDADVRAEVERLGTLVVDGNGDPYRGKRLYERSCGKCHLLFGEGGRIGPDLTPFQRSDHVNLLVNVLRPSAEVREGFETYAAVTDEGRVVIGFLQDRDERLVVLRNVEGVDVRLPTESIDEMRRLKTSMMPEGLLKYLTDAEIRDLFAYLRSAQPLNE